MNEDQNVLINSISRQRTVKLIIVPFILIECGNGG